MTLAPSATHFAPPDRLPVEELNRLHSRLAEDEGLCSLLDAMPEFVMIVGSSRQVLYGNRPLADFAASHGTTAFLGMRPGELLSCCHALAAPSGCGTAEECSTCGAVETILAALDGNRACHECRVLRQTENGLEALDLKVWGTPLRWNGLQLVLLVAVDISDEKRRKVLERIFFHDILNTAGVIDSLAQLLMEGVLSFDEAKESLRETTRNLVNEILSQRELLAAEHNELTLHPEPLHSTLFLEGVVLSYENTPLGQGRQIVVSPESAKVIFYSDGRLLGRVVGNLVKNALEASSEGGIVTLGCRTEGEAISFWCHNREVMPRETQLQVFHRSFSTKEVGRGIGTYSVKLLTERYLKGRVSFTSDERRGTTFTVTYPLDLRH